MSGRIYKIILVLALTLIAGRFAPVAAQDGPLVAVQQGSRWTPSLRDEFYYTDQGSRIMPLAWMRALKAPDGSGFLDDRLARYGYLAPLPGSQLDMPVGFTVAPFRGADHVGMTCAACHTRDLSVAGTRYRVDGGPAFADFQSFLKDLDSAVAAVLSDEARFAEFAATAGEADTAALRTSLTQWHTRYATIVERSLPDPAWGPGRLDAISMIFNRLTGLDIGTRPDRMIPDNIARADVPTRYPFLWNAARQDRTQWPGFAGNGNDILALARNLGQVYGVFAEFYPQDESLFPLNRNYIAKNSANFDGIQRIEELIWEIGPPKYPWPVDATLAAAGAEVFGRSGANGGCAECHDAGRGEFRSPFHSTIRTPIQDVKTDTRECRLLERTVATGVLEGAKIPFSDSLKTRDLAFNVLTTAVLGAITQQTLGHRPDDAAAEALGEAALPPELEYLRDAYRLPPPVAAAEAFGEPGCAYEARLLEGIWAAAPYLHNGSVPTLAELLKPAAERVAAFKLGSEYDIEAVGLATEQPRSDYTLVTTGCEDVGSGNSRCGHEYGTGLSDEDRRALLEYLKTL